MAPRSVRRLIAPFALLMLAVLSLWFGGETSTPLRRLLWLAPFAGAVTAGLMTGVVRPLGLLWIGALLVAAHAFCLSESSPRRRIIAAITLLVLAGGLMAHQLPGFHNPLVIAGATFSEDALPFRLHLNFDKTCVGLLLLGLCHPRIVHLADWRAMAGRAWPITVGMIAVLTVVSLASGYVRFDPKFPREAWLWMAVNLGFTCVAEEALFRGFIQRNLQWRYRHVRHGEWLALLIAAILFGFAHAAGGPAYVALATVGGIGYGWVYLRTGRIEASILTHFALNATHFVGFTYPALKVAS